MKSVAESTGGGSNKAMNAKPPGRNRTGIWLAWTLAIVVQLVLLAALLADFKGTWILIEIHNFAVVLHYVFFQLAGTTESGLVIVPLFLVYEAVLVCVWAAIVYWGGGWLKRKFFQNGVSRRQKWVAVIGLLVFAAGALVWPMIVSHFDRPTAFTASQDAKSLVQGNNSFALDLYQRLKERPGNLFFSPYSISRAMGMVYAGARGTTEGELAATLHYNLPQSNLHAAFGEVAGRFQGIQRWNRLVLLQANSLWYQRNYSFTPAYMDLVHARYQAELKPVDFRNAAPATGKKIAEWIKESSGRLLKQAVDPGVLSSDTRLALCDTIYFWGRWASEFSPDGTRPGPFFTGPDQSVTVPMMHQKADFKLANVACEEGWWIDLLELPYYGRDLSMVLLLPNKVDGLAELERALDSTNLNAWLAQLDNSSQREAHVSLPRFTVQRSVNLVEELKRMGLRSPFGPDADLSGMTGTTQLYISDVLHQAFITVNEQGTEAAAMTLATANTKGMAGSFIADHPFIYLIRDNATGSILFLGRMSDPSRE